MTNLLSQQYKSGLHQKTPLKPPKNGNSLSEITITEEDMKEVIDNMTIMSAPGPDRITAAIYK